MGLATAALERGDGEWENIQDVLRNAFLVHETQLRRHGELLDSCEQHTRESSAKWTDVSEQLAKVESVPAHVDKLARVVNALSEELKQRAQADQERQQQQAKWMASVTRTVEMQFEKLQIRIIGEIETKYSKSVATLERRMDLVEEELEHFVTALERKADVEMVKDHVLTIEEAVKQRCRKAAFDKEVVRLHQLLRSQHTRMDQRIEAIQKDVQHQLASYLQTQEQQQQHQKHDDSADAETERRQQRLREDLMDAMTEKLNEAQDASMRYTETQITTAQESLSRVVEQQLGKQGDAFSLRLHEVDTRERVTLVEQQWSDWRQHAADAKEEITLKITTLREELGNTSKMVAERFGQHERNHHTIHEVLLKQFAQVQEEQSRLQTQINQAVVTATQQSDQTERLRIAHEQQLDASRDELRELAKARDKKTRQQMHVVADKLREMDQILKLVGKQLVQNTSHVQLLWIDAHDEVESHGDVKLLQVDGMNTGDTVTISEPFSEDGTNADAVGDEADASQHSTHAQLQASIEAKLRDYEDVLEAKDATNDDTKTL